MLTSTRRSIVYPNPNRSDSADAPRDFYALVQASEVEVIYGQGTLALRPTSTPGSPGIQGRIYYATDDLNTYYDYGTGWAQVGVSSVGTAQIQDGAVTTVKLASSVPVIPLGGTIDFPWGSAYIPSWALLPVGQSLTQAAYGTLYTIAAGSGYPHGGSGTNFSLPDMRGRTSAGADNMGGTAAGRITVGLSGNTGTLGAIAGAEGITLTSAMIPAHNHGPGTLSVASHDHGGGNHYHNLSVAQNLAGGTLYPKDEPATSVAQTATAASVQYSGNIIGAQAPVVNAGTTANNTGGGGAHSSMQPTVFVNKIMRVV